MNYVYKIIFNRRKQNNVLPYYYIGSKSNAMYEHGQLLDSNRKAYYGSSSYDGYYELIESDDITTEILGSFNEYIDALNYEKYIQEKEDVVANPKYFNLAIATVNNFTNPEYASYKHIVTGKRVRLPRNHHMVENGEYVGVSFGSTLPEEIRKKIGRKGLLNPFYGKHHTEDTKVIISSKTKGLKISEERRKAFIQNVAKMKKTDEHKAKIGRKGLIMLKNKNTGECVRIPKEEKPNYDSNVWVNPYVLSKNKSTGSRWVTNGEKNIKLKSEEKLPPGFNYGRTYSEWNKRKKK